MLAGGAMGGKFFIGGNLVELNPFSTVLQVTFNLTKKAALQLDNSLEFHRLLPDQEHSGFSPIPPLFGWQGDNWCLSVSPSPWNNYQLSIYFASQEIILLKYSQSQQSIR
jgi:hypothetical protein